MAGRGRASVADMARVELAILQSIDAVEKRGDAAGFSRAWLAKQVGVSEWRIHAAISRLSEAGLLDQEVHFTEAGAQLTNTYSITDSGRWYFKGLEMGKRIASEKR